VAIQASTCVSPASFIAAARLASGEPKLTPSTTTSLSRSNALAELLTKNESLPSGDSTVKRNARLPPPFG
jgi:hypothetical protein